MSSVGYVGNMNDADEKLAYDNKRRRKLEAMLREQGRWENGMTMHRMVEPRRNPISLFCNEIARGFLLMLGALETVKLWTVWRVRKAWRQANGTDGSGVSAAATPPAGDTAFQGIWENLVAGFVGPEQVRRNREKARRAERRAKMYERLRMAREVLRTVNLLVLTLTFTAIALRAVLYVWGVQ